MIPELLLRFKWAMQRAFRGYDNTIYWSFGGYMENYLPQLKHLCELNIEDVCGRGDIFLETIYLIDKRTALQQALDKSKTPQIRVINQYRLEDHEKEMWIYLGKNMRFYWS